MGGLSFKMNNQNYQQDKNNLEALDIITMLSFAMQTTNIQKDEKQTEYIHKVIKAIANEIEKLHKENDIIIKQNEKILNLLEAMYYHDK